MLVIKRNEPGGASLLVLCRKFPREKSGRERRWYGATKISKCLRDWFLASTSLVAFGMAGCVSMRWRGVCKVQKLKESQRKVNKK
mmetsp:Transcript_18758/g.37924  ORF Transcript_18758/g.37924 Transcript_18758/m.37924 type:complete len:85 (-) Transcript_18758:525-779(-)